MENHLNRKYYLLSGLLLCLLVSGCAPSYLQRGHLAMIKQGSSVEEVNGYLAKVDIDRKVNFEVNGEQYLGKLYSLQTGTQESMSMVCSPTCIAIPVYIPVTAQYAFIFNSATNKLVAWGLIEELSKNPDEAIRGLMPALKSALKTAVK